MFDSKIYVQRRQQLKKDVKSGLILITGNNESPMNYPANTYHYRQDSNFLYFFGIDKPGFTGLIDIDGDKDYLFGYDFTIDDIIWMGPQPRVKELGAQVGINETAEPAKLEEMINQALGQGRKVHYLPPYRADNLMEIGRLLGLRNNAVKQYVSLELIQAVVKQRELKSADEVAEMEKALDISYHMYKDAMNLIAPGKVEREVWGIMEGIAATYGSHVSFPIILSVHGETLHNHYHGNTMKDGDLLVIDSGAESPLHYASDITRTFPVSGKFTSRQKEIYEIVLKAQDTAIEAIKPGIMNKEIHLKTATVIAQGLKDLGLMKGDVQEAVKQGAHALFFPHGLGHMIGLDVHDMEDLGENHVGYDSTVVRSDQFGLAYLRLAKELKPNFVLTVEPGIYFIPALIDKWRTEKNCMDFINYEKLEEFKTFGGIRIEDDVLVTGDSYKVLGKGIPKTTADIEKIMGK